MLSGLFSKQTIVTIVSKHFEEIIFYSKLQFLAKIPALRVNTIKSKAILPAKLRIQPEGATLETNECIYFADGVVTTLVSLGALKNLKCVPENFPLPPSDTASSLPERDEEEYEEDKQEAKPSQPTPNWPQELPFSATMENVPKLKAWLINKFPDSRFNTSSVPLAMMTGYPMKIHIDDKVYPVAIHKPIPIPHHWQAEVKAQLNRDEELGIIEQVPMGIPTRWQSRMVVMAKKNGKTQMHCGSLSSQQALLERNSLDQDPILPSIQGEAEHLQERGEHLERFPRGGARQGVKTADHLHHPVRKIRLLQGPTGAHMLWRCLHQEGG